MSQFPLTSLATLLALVVYFILGALVGKARVTYGVAAPATTGHIEFEKRYRVQMNTVEQIIILLPVMWLCAAWVGDRYAALGGLVWSIGRVLYARGYYVAPGKREAGYGITILASAAMLAAVLVAVIRAYL